MAESIISGDIKEADLRSRFVGGKHWFEHDIDNKVFESFPSGLPAALHSLVICVRHASSPIILVSFWSHLFDTFLCHFFASLPVISFKIGGTMDTNSYSEGLRQPGMKKLAAHQASAPA